MAHLPPEPYPARGKALPTGARLAADLVRNASDAVLAVDRGGNIVFWNDGAEQLFGWPAAEAVGRPATFLLPPDRQDELERVLRALVGAPEPAAIETFRLHKSGAVLPVSCRMSPLIDADGYVYGASAVVRDNSRELELRRQLEQAHQIAEARFTQSLVAQATLDTRGRLTAVNPRLCELSGYSERQLLGRPVLDFLAPDQQDIVVAALRRLLSGELRRVEERLRLRRADGELVPCRVSTFAAVDDSGRIQRFEAVVDDVSETVEAQRALATSEARWQSLACRASDVAFLTDADAVIEFASGSVTTQFGYAPADLVGADGFAFFHPDDQPAVRAHFARVLERPGEAVTFEARVQHADGSWRWIEETATNRLHAAGIEAVVVNIVDVTERRRAEAVLQELAGRDALTGLATRAPLLAALDAAISDDEAAGTAVVVLGLDRFRAVNAASGHQVGDDVLSAVATGLRACAVDVAVAARLGGDQFALVLSGFDTTESLEPTIRTLQAAVAEAAQGTQAALPVTATVGAALGPADDSSSLLAAAEAALAEAKRSGPESISVRRARSTSGAVQRSTLVRDLRRGLDAGEIVVHYQPVVSVGTGRVHAVEALVRWQHPERGLLPPGAFLDAAEDSGLIVAIGQTVLRQACEAAARWAHLGPAEAPFRVAVNLSANQLTAPGVVALVRDCLDASGADPAALMLEVTESAVMADLEATARTLQSLRELGLSIAVDDFGTGYSSLTYLKRFPVTCVKIDRSFVSGLGVDDQDAAIVSSVLSLARAIGLECVAEGVETEEQRLVLQALGCELGQGYLWSPALAADELEQWVERAGTGTTPVRRRRRRAPVEPAPTTSVPDDGPTDADRSAAAAAVARILEMHGRGASLNTIAAALNADGVRTADGKRWSARTVARAIAIGPLAGMARAEDEGAD
ncbi:MAG TPA: EAL domain-containing protein [Mycobacteriales bacterium]|nr:EAL domain-containing protein [Mycobacteriales bacterium]